jgi:hypothetical protein
MNFNLLLTTLTTPPDFIWPRKFASIWLREIKSGAVVGVLQLNLIIVLNNFRGREHGMTIDQPKVARFTNHNTTYKPTPHSKRKMREARVKIRCVRQKIQRGSYLPRVWK